MFHSLGVAPGLAAAGPVLVDKPRGHISSHTHVPLRTYCSEWSSTSVDTASDALSRIINCTALWVRG